MKVPELSVLHFFRLNASSTHPVVRPISGAINLNCRTRMASQAQQKFFCPSVRYLKSQKIQKVLCKEKNILRSITTRTPLGSAKLSSQNGVLLLETQSRFLFDKEEICKKKSNVFIREKNQVEVRNTE